MTGWVEVRSRETQSTESGQSEDQNIIKFLRESIHFSLRAEIREKSLRAEIREKCRRLQLAK
jgi:hypothetical protein